MNKVIRDSLRALQRGLAQRYCTDAKLKEVFEHAKDFAMKTEERTGGLEVMFVAHMHRREDKSTQNEWIEVPVVFSDWPPPDDKKYGILEGLGVKLATDFPDYMLVCVVQIAEVWIASYAQEDVERDGIKQMPSERADKMEAVFVDALTIDQRESTGSYPIIRKSSGAFGTWGAPRENLYDPDSDDDTEMHNALIMHIFKGSTGAFAKHLEHEIENE